ncbi:MAG: hypothetical protein FWH55_14245 [Oscillospiraceae bacterium]|nr:hypothetical protein [Oscillospiraceae bacterium]
MSDYNQQPGYNQNRQYGSNQPNPQQSNPQQPYSQQSYSQQPYPQQPYPQQTIIQQQQAGGQWPHMRVGEWIVTMLLMLVPILNIVLVFVWAFGSNVNPSKKSYFQAMLIWAAVGVLLSIVLVSVFATAISALLFELNRSL